MNPPLSQPQLSPSLKSHDDYMTRVDPGFLVAGGAKYYEIKEGLSVGWGCAPPPAVPLSRFGCSGNLGSFTRNKGTCFPY